MQPASISCGGFRSAQARSPMRSTRWWTHKATTRRGHVAVGSGPARVGRGPRRIRSPAQLDGFNPVRRRDAARDGAADPDPSEEAQEQYPGEALVKRPAPLAMVDA